MTDELGELIYTLGQRSHQFRVLLEDRAHSPDLTQRERLLLERLHEEGPMGMSQVGERFPGVATSTLSGDIAELWSGKGYIEKVIDRDSPRSRIIRLSSEGEECVRDIAKAQAEMYGAIIQALEPTDRERKTLINLLRRGIPKLEERIRSKASEEIQ